MTYRIEYTNRFEKDLKQAVKRGKDLDKLFAVIDKLAMGIPLEPKQSSSFDRRIYGILGMSH